MEHEQIEKDVARKSALIYLPIASGAGLLFLLAASLSGGYPLVARIWGTVWVGLLSLIVSMPLVTARVKRQAQGLAAQSPISARWRISAWPVVALLAFVVGLGAGYLLWGRTAARADLESAQATSALQNSGSATAAPTRQVVLPEAYALPVRLGKIGPQLVAAGAIDYSRFVQVYQQAGQPLPEKQLEILSQGSDDPLTIDKENAYFLLNFFWALGLTNQNPILTQGPMMQAGRDQIGNYASTGGWTIAPRPVAELYASTPIITLTVEQQAGLEEVAARVFRPCCNNPTLFPDCNHGMAMLGLLELMAAQGATTDEMYTAAKYVNAFWFPQQTLELATYFKATKSQDFAQVDARQVVGPEFSSASGAQTAHRWLADNGLLESIPNSGNRCGV